MKNISINSGVTLTPTGYTNTGSYNFTWTNPTNAYTNADSTNYASLKLAVSRNSARQNQVYIEFDKTPLSDIPSNATISSVDCNVKYYVSSTSYITALSAQLYTNTTKKGTATTTRSTSAAKYSLSTGSWTRNELNNVRLYLSATRSTSSTGTSAYVYFYGADVTVNYTVNGVAYEVTVTNTSSNAEVSPTYFSGETGEDFTFNITGIDNIDDIEITDNNDNVTSQAVFISPTSSFSSASSQVATSEFTTGGSRTGTVLYRGSNSNTGSTWLEQAIGRTAENPNNTQTGYTYAKSSESAQYTSGWIIYNFDFTDIPENASITSTSVKVYGAREDSTNDETHRARVELYCGDTPKGSYYDLTNTTAQLVTIPSANVGTWTRAELQDAKLRFSVAYYGGRMNGITWTVNYTVPATPGHYEYTVSNITEDHDIEVSDAVTKHQITASSTFNGVHITPTSTMVVEGNMAEFTINSQNTYSIKLLDNGVDKTSTITGSAGNYKYRIQNVTSAHTLVLSEATYYNVTGSSTYTGATVSAPGKVYAGQNATVTVSVGNKYEIVFKDNNVDKTSSLNGSTGTLTYTLTNVQTNHAIAVSEATNYTITTSSSYNGVTVTANPTKVYAGRSCTITIAGASKDTMTVKDNNTDVTSSLVGSSSPYTYTLNNVAANHTITVVPITYAVNASSTFAGVSITPTSSTVIKGNSVTLTINAPNTYSIKVTDNGTTVTGSLTGSAGNYKYTISNVTAAHTVVVSEASYFTVSGSSSYNGATLTVPGKVYAGQNATVTVAVGNKHEIVFKDNNTDKTSSLAGTTGTLTYTLTNVQADHTITITEASYYTISTSSNYTGATISANPVKVYTGQSTKSSEITLSVSNLYEVVVKDGTTVITNSFTGSNGTFKYTLTNIAANHSITVTEATYYTITTSSTYAPAHISANPTKVYAGRSTTITITGASKNDIIVKDNGTNVTSSLVGSNTTYAYTISNVATNHTVTVEEKPAVTYQVNASSTYSRATITPTASTVVEGDTLVLTITGDVVPIKVTDNNTDVTASLVTNGSSRTYTLTNITMAHTIVVSFVQTVLVKTSGGYVAGKKFYKKTAASTWTEMTLSELQTYLGSNQTFYE